MNRMSWKTLQIEGIARIEREVARFTVEPKHADLPMGFRIKIIEHANGGFSGVPEIAVKDAAGTPDWIVGMGNTVEEALADAVRYLLQSVRQREPLGDDSIWWDPRF